MPSAINPAEALNKLTAALSAALTNGKKDLIVNYSAVSRAFPGGPHQNTFEHDAIDFRALRQWATENNWTVDVAPETTPKELQHSPNIRFTKKG